MESISRLPSEFINRIRSIVPKVYQEQVFSSFNHAKPTTLRVNTLKSTSEELVQKMSERGFKIQAFKHIPNSLVLIGNKTLRELTEVDLYKQGFFYVQNLSSMIPPLVLNPSPLETVLDLSAAPGSKTTQMASIMENSGQIVAVDVSQTRVYKLLANIKTQGVTNTKVVRTDGRFYWRENIGKFDKVLLDAPCSSEGRIQLSDVESYSRWSTKEIKKHEYTQKSLIFSAVNCLKPGGVLVYSTCTFSPEENEEIIDFVLRKFPGKLKTMEMDLKIENKIPGLSAFNGKVFDQEVLKSVRILPNENFEGFFICKMLKLI